MGLDFTIYKKRKDENNDWMESFDKWNEHELCYGRKSWELVHFLELPIDSEEDPIVEKENWIKLMDAFKSFLKDKNASYFEEIRNAYDIVDKYEEKGWEIPKECKETIVNYETWYDRTFDEYPTLGYEFALGYLQSFYEADEEVRKYMSNSEYEVRASVSY